MCHDHTLAKCRFSAIATVREADTADPYAINNSLKYSDYYLNEFIEPTADDTFCISIRIINKRVKRLI